MSGSIVPAVAETRVSPVIALGKGTLVRIEGPERGDVRHLEVLGWWPGRDARPSYYSCVDHGTGAQCFLDDPEIATLCRLGRFGVVRDADGSEVPSLPSRLDLTPDEQAACERCRAYVDEYLADPTRSRQRLVPRIGDLAAQRGESPPGFSTVLGWVDRWELLGEARGNDCFHNLPRPGNRRHKLSSDLVRQAVEFGVLSALRMPKGTGLDALKLAKAWVSERHAGLVVGEDEWPNVRTMQTRMTSQNRFVADGLSFGEGYAWRKHRQIAERPRPDMPLEEVECDNTPLDIIVVDDERRVQFGRTNMIGFLDRATGHPLGFSVDFEGPSYPGFLAGLRHSFFPKDMSAYPGFTPWEAYGRPKRLFVDNALEFIGDNIRAAGSRLNFEIAEFRPGNPWLKGAQERLFGIVNARVHALPGATMSDVGERKLYRDTMTKPILTVSELRAFLMWWFCDEFNVGEHEGLGFLRTLKGVPRDRWRARIDRVRMGPLPSEYEFIQMAGDISTKAVRQQGIRWDHIRYGHPDLIAITSHPDHRVGRFDPDRRGTKLHGSRYHVCRDPFDLGRVFVTNHHARGRSVIEVPAYNQAYAAGLTLHQHRVLIANANKEELAQADEPEVVLMRARREVERYVQFLLTERQAQGVQRKLARLLETGYRDHRRSVVSRKSVSASLSRDVLDVREPLSLPRTSAGNPATFEVVDGVPSLIDSGAAVAAARAARGRRGVDDRQTAAPSRSRGSDAERRAIRRAGGWDAGGTGETAPDGPPAGPPSPPPSPDRPSPAPAPARPDASDQVPTGRGDRRSDQTTSRSPQTQPQRDDTVADDASASARPAAAGSSALREAVLSGHAEARATRSRAEDDDAGTRMGDGGADGSDAAAERRRRRAAGGWGKTEV